VTANRVVTASRFTASVITRAREAIKRCVDGIRHHQLLDDAGSKVTAQAVLWIRFLLDSDLFKCTTQAQHFVFGSCQLHRASAAAMQVFVDSRHVDHG
jgi:hypothetical protein